MWVDYCGGGGGGGQSVCWPPLSNYWGPAPPWFPLFLRLWFYILFVAFSVIGTVDSRYLDFDYLE